MARLWDRACPAESIGPFTRRPRCPRCLAQVGWGGVSGWCAVCGVVTEGGSVAAASISIAPVVSFVCRVLRVLARALGPLVRLLVLRWVPGVLVVPLFWLCTALLGVAASMASGMGMDPESGASVSVGSLTGGAEVASTGDSCGVEPASSRGLSGSSTVSIVCCPVASLSA